MLVYLLEILVMICQPNCGWYTQLAASLCALEYWFGQLVYRRGILVIVCKLICGGVLVWSISLSGRGTDNDLLAYLCMGSDLFC